MHAGCTAAKDSGGINTGVPNKEKVYHTRTCRKLALQFFADMHSPQLSRTRSRGSQNLLSAAHELLRLRLVREALSTYDSAQIQGWPMPECAAGRWMCWMLLGEFER